MMAARNEIPGIHRILILGFGRTGRAVAEHCVVHGIGFRVSESGRLAGPAREWALRHAESIEEGGHTLDALTGVDTVVPSPGVPMTHPLIRAAVDRRVRVLSEIDLASLFASDRPVFAVTGTNGKTTTTELIGALLRAAGKDPVIAGNIGTPYIAMADHTSSCDAIVLEVSSYQLEQSTLFHPRIAVLLNLSPDHLARHRTLEAYAAAKARIFEHQVEGDVAVLPRHLLGLFPHGRARRLAYDRPGLALPTGAEDLADHNRANLAAAITAVGALDQDLVADLNLDAVRSVFDMPHRLQTVGQVGSVRAVNDSKSTNAGSTVAALRAVNGPIVLLLGGQRKASGYEELADEIRRSDVQQVIAFGDASGFFIDLLSRHAPSVPALEERDLGRAVELGLKLAPDRATLLFSPACASFDQFTGYAARGEAFAKMISQAHGFTLAATP